MNKVELKGRLVREPVFKTTKLGKTMAFITLAVWKGTTADGDDLGAEFIDVTVFKQWLIDEMETNKTKIKKGTMLEITGKLQVNAQDKMNKKLFVSATTIEVVPSTIRDNGTQNDADDESVLDAIKSQDDVDWDLIDVN